MNNYESMKQMSLEQMTVSLYLLVAPFAEALKGGKLEESERLEILGQLKTFLQTEVKKTNE